MVILGSGDLLGLHFHLRSMSFLHTYLIKILASSLIDDKGIHL